MLEARQRNHMSTQEVVRMRRGLAVMLAHNLHMWQDGEVNGLGRLRVSASSREEHAWTKPQGRRGGVLAVYGEGALKGTHTHPYI